MFSLAYECLNEVSSRSGSPWSDMSIHLPPSRKQPESSVSSTKKAMNGFFARIIAGRNRSRRPENKVQSGRQSLVPVEVSRSVTRDVADSSQHSKDIASSSADCRGLNSREHAIGRLNRNSGAGARERVCYVEVKSLSHDSDDSDTSISILNSSHNNRSRSIEKASRTVSKASRSTSRSRDIIALYTNKHRPVSRDRQMENKSSCSSATLLRVSSFKCNVVKSDCTVSNENISATISRQRSHSLPRSCATTTDDRISINGTDVYAQGYFTQPRRALSNNDIATENLRVWMTSTLEKQRKSNSQASLHVEAKPKHAVELEMDATAEARIEEYLNRCNSIVHANVPILAIASYARDEIHWNAQDELNVEAGSILTGLYKQKEWLRVRKANGEEGFIPYAFTRLIRTPVAANAQSTPRECKTYRPAVTAFHEKSRNPVMSRTGYSAHSIDSKAADSRTGSYSQKSDSVSSSNSSSNAKCNQRNTATERRSAAVPPGHKSVCQFYHRSHLVLENSELRRNTDDASSIMSSEDSVVCSPAGRAKRRGEVIAPSRNDMFDSGVFWMSNGHCREAVHSDSGISEPGSVRSDCFISDQVRQRWTGEARFPASPSLKAPTPTLSRQIIRPSFNGDPAMPKTYLPAKKPSQLNDCRHLSSCNISAGTSGHYGTSKAVGLCIRAPQREANGSSWKPLRPDIPKNYSGPNVRVMYDYNAVNIDDLSVSAGAMVRLLNSEDTEWVWVSKSDGTEGFVPKKYVSAQETNRMNRAPLSATAV